MILNKSYPSSPNSCYDDFIVLGEFKKRIDSLKLIVGNTSKTTITPDKLRQMEIDYENQKKLYESSECMNNFEKNKCQYLDKNITSSKTLNRVNKVFETPQANKELQNRIDAMSLEYKNLNCDAVINKSRGEYISEVTNIFNTLDKKRIQSTSIYERNKRVIFGGVVLILGLALIMDFSKSKK